MNRRATQKVNREQTVIKVLLAEDMHMVRGALVALLDLEHDIEVVAEVASGNEILPAAHKHQPDVAIIDIDLPGIDGLTAAGELHESLPRCRTLILTSLGRPGTVRRALDARVNGFMLKDAPPEKLANAVRQVAVGRRVIDSELALAAWDTDVCPLTTRETEILRLLAAGRDVGDVAAQLFLSPGTVRNYLTTAVTKLNARNRVDAIRIATEAGWI
ncbi:two component transcriptional regulator, LuxR family [Amycolatopsis marina]|uniref:Two component transcriptional regulator, LuxR family n=1 Tax=Amycolatopsis marina TaxID=490629 RepID=A0A1I0ZIP5_9PSEU|nr:response regulator transcription factor [Amycolatopsis marina]SFB25297.1 two component transcriptional regulator, LuxR family [Amycolatopsis marina]